MFTSVEMLQTELCIIHYSDTHQNVQNVPNTNFYQSLNVSDLSLENPDISHSNFAQDEKKNIYKLKTCPAHF